MTLPLSEDDERHDQAVKAAVSYTLVSAWLVRGILTAYFASLEYQGAQFVECQLGSRGDRMAQAVQVLLTPATPRETLVFLRQLGDPEIDAMVEKMGFE